MKVKTPSAVPTGMERQLTPAMIRLNSRDRRRWRQRPETIVRMPMVQPNTIPHEPIPTNIQPRNGGGACDCITGIVVGVAVVGSGRGRGGGAKTPGFFSIASPITMWMMKIDEKRIVTAPQT